MVYAHHPQPVRCVYFEVDSTESVWYKPAGMPRETCSYFEVDSTESVWYRVPEAVGDAAQF